MKNSINLTRRILPSGRMILMAATVAVLLATGAPAMAKPGQPAHVPALALAQPNQVLIAKHYPYMPLFLSLLRAIETAVPQPLAW